MSAVPGLARLADTASFILQAANILQVPVLATEQNPHKLGHTLPTLAQYIDTQYITHKSAFSMDSPELRGLMPVGTDTAILLGIETHVCVLQTCQDLIRSGMSVYVVCDAVTSRRAYDRAVALQHMQALGARLTTAESIVFQIMKDSKHPKFKDISNLIKKQSVSQEFPFGPQGAL
jgi:hypothetical protein